LGAISRRSAGTLGGRYSRWHPQRVERFQLLYKLRDSGVARLPLFGNFSYSATLWTNFKLNKLLIEVGNQRVTERVLGRPEPVAAPAPVGSASAAFRYDDGGDHPQHGARGVQR
jgi:hypothetical protein